MTSLDLFAGAGGMTLGFKSAGITSVGAIEIDRFAAETFAYNFPEIPLYIRDIYSFTSEEILERFSGVDIIAGGPPCQGFSVAGPSQYGIIDQRNSLIMEFFRFIKLLRPKYAVLENVKGILNGKMNATQKALNTYIAAMQDVGYVSKVFILQAADFGVPQYRERVVVLSALSVEMLPTQIKADFAGQENWIKVADVFGDLPDIKAGEGTNELVPYKTEPQSDYQRYLRKDSKGVTNHIAMKHSSRLIERFAQIPQGGSLLNVPTEFGQRQRNGSKLDVKKRYKTNNQRLHPERVSNIITASFQSTFVHPYLDRNLTAREGARLQSFPDSFFFCGPRTLMSKSLLVRESRENEIGLSQYNQIGNAVPPRMAEAIGKCLMEMEKTTHMTYDEMLVALQSFSGNKTDLPAALPHYTNLLTQLQKRDKDTLDWFNNTLPKYIGIRSVKYQGDLQAFVEEITARTNDYMNMLWPPKINPFSHQTDFTSSVIPEVLCLVFKAVIDSVRMDLEVSAQKDLTIECIFDATAGGSIIFKNKRVDAAVIQPSQLSFNGVSSEFPIPLMAIECKTNLDKNMISGIEHSVSDLKKTFPNCKYYVVTELSDFDIKKSNYASSGIDEMYVLRRQKRATTRKEADKRHDLCSDLILEIAQNLLDVLQQTSQEVLTLDMRMGDGRLIGGQL